MCLLPHVVPHKNNDVLYPVLPHSVRYGVKLRYRVYALATCYVGFSARS